MADKLPSLESLQRKIDEAKSQTGSDKQDTSSDNDQSGFGQAMRLGTELVAGLAVGSFIGYYVDHWLNTFPLFFIICFFLGAIAGFKNLMREAENMDDE